jgi:DNA-binding NarL/FixJ family response regulator
MSESLKKLTVCITDDHPLVRHGILSALSADKKITTLAQGETADDAVANAIKFKPDIMLLDLGIPGGGIEALKKIVSQVPTVRCVILTVCDNPKVAIEAIKCGAKGYILKGTSGKGLVTALRSIIQNETFVSPEFATKLLLESQGAVENTEATDLNFRENQVIAEVAKGKTNKEVAKALKVSEKTVKHYMSRVFQAYGVSNRVGAVVAYRQEKQSNTAMATTR